MKTRLFTLLCLVSATGGNDRIIRIRQGQFVAPTR
jgi:hypothetical protein